MAFWRSVSAALTVFVAGLILLPKPTHYLWKAPVWARVALYSLMAMAVAVVWAILFRPRVEKLKISLHSLLALVAMEAVLFWAIQRFSDY